MPLRLLADENFDGRVTAALGITRLLLLFDGASQLGEYEGQIVSLP